MNIQLRVTVALAADVRAEQAVGASASERIQDWRPDDEVVLAFEHADPRAPYIVGLLWDGNDKPPIEAHGTLTRHHVVSETAKPL